jgi:predicted DNA-binding protein
MNRTVTFRLDPETARILKDLTRRNGSSRSQVIREALHAQWESATQDSLPTAWEVYSRLKIPKVRPHRDTARHYKELLKEKLIAKHRDGTL